MGPGISTARRLWLLDLLPPELGGTTRLKVLMVGLDAVGKTTLLYRFKLDEFVDVMPTIGFNVESFRHGNVAFTAWEVGGGDKIRPLWRHYYEGTNAFVFIVDSTDRNRLQEARDALHMLRESPEVQKLPLLVLANKQDMPTAMSAEEIAVGLDIHKLMTSAVAVLPVAVKDGTGLTQALDWLTLQSTGRPSVS